jgi:hypothetical protein
VCLTFSRLPEDGTPVPKHVGVDTYRELYFAVFILFYFAECICWLYADYQKIYGMCKIKFSYYTITCTVRLRVYFPLSR